jgi:hypothetical protein
VRPVLVIAPNALARAAGAVVVLGVAACSLGAAPLVAIHAGDAITDRQLFSYLSFGLHPGDWMEYRVVFAGGTEALKTVGFGTESVSGTPTLYIESHVRSLAVTGLPPGMSAVGIGTDAVIKTYISGGSFGDLYTQYSVVTSALKIGALEYEVAPETGETYTALAGDVFSPDRRGTVASVDAVEMRVGSQTVHATHIVAKLGSLPLPAGGVSNGYTIELWQSPEVPGGTVAIASPGELAVRWSLIAFGRGYRSLFKHDLDDIRSGSQPAMP